jgi:phosphoglycerate dehydrogenase-like enzyme
MIRILIADRLQSQTIDLLNEISEFEIIEKPGLTSTQLQEEIKNADALIISGSMPLSEEILNQGGDLKLIVRSSGVSGPIDTAAAQGKNIEIRTAVGHNTAQLGNKMEETIEIDVIAILKEFFNV